ncbi:MAG: methylated-DNA--[protein]-cysteine S-methyltransferase [Thermoplasmatota archaeon]
MSRRAVHFLASPVGTLLLEASDDGLSRVNFAPSREPDRSMPADMLLASAASQLKEYFAGARRAFDLPLAMDGTEFRERVWRALLDVPYGKTASYLDIALALGDPESVRAVGAANGANPIAIVVPCHRIIGSDGSLTGYGGGLDNKRWLLALERKVASGQATLAVE